MSPIRRVWSGAVVAAVLTLSACGTAGGGDWHPTAPTASVDISHFKAAYQPVLADLTVATTGAGFAWDDTTQGPDLVDKFGICSWRIERSGTWGGNENQGRDLRNTINRALVQNHFHAADWAKPADRDDHSVTLISQDDQGALLESSLNHPATIAIYSPASGGTCTKAESTPSPSE